MLKMQRILIIFEMQTHEFNHEGLFYHNGLGTNGGGGGAPPWGVSIRRPPKVCEACWTIITSPVRYVLIKSQRANLKGQAHYARPGSCSPLFFSPQEAGDRRNPPSDLRFLRFFGLLGRFFALLKRSSKFTSKKMRKSRIWASQNPPKIHPKWL